MQYSILSSLLLVLFDSPTSGFINAYELKFKLVLLTLFDKFLAIFNELQHIFWLPNKYWINYNHINYGNYHIKCKSIVMNRYCFKHYKCGCRKHQLRTTNQKNRLSRAGWLLLLIRLRWVNANGLMKFLNKLKKFDWTGHDGNLYQTDTNRPFQFYLLSPL